MQSSNSAIPNLRDILSAASTGVITRHQLHELVAISHALAVTFLRGKISRAALDHRFQQLSYADLALDCIAELFRQDEKGRLIQIKAYVDGLAFRQLSDEEILISLRRLVFSKVNQGIFRIYHELDPSLGKILRNLKLAIHNVPSLRVTVRFGDLCVSPASSETLEHLPTFEREELLSELSGRITGNERIPELLATLSNFLGQQSVRSRIIPLVVVALTIRTLFSRPNQILAEEPAAEGELLIDDMSTLIAGVCRKVRRETRAKYVGKQKVSPEMFDLFFEAIEIYLQRRLLGQAGTEDSLFEAFQAAVPDISREQYMITHRSQMEYLCRLTHRLVLRQIRKRLLPHA